MARKGDKLRLKITFKYPAKPLFMKPWIPCIRFTISLASIIIIRVLQTASDFPQTFPYLEEKYGKKY